MCMQSEKQNIKWMLTVGIITLVLGLFSLAFTAVYIEGNKSLTIIQGSNSTTITSINFTEILYLFGSFCLIIGGVLLIVFYVLGKKDSIQIEDNVILCDAQFKQYTLEFNEIESVKSSTFGLYLKRKSDLKALLILFVKNSYEIAKFIEDKLKDENQ